MYFTPAWVYTRVITRSQQNVRSFYGMLGRTTDSFRGEILAVVALRKNRRLEPMLTAPLFIIRRMQGMATISMHGWYAMNYNFMYIRRVQYSSCYNMCIATLQVGITSFCAPWHIQANPLVSRGWPFFAHSTYPLASTTQRSV